MAKLELLEPFLLHFEAGVPIKDLDMPAARIYDIARESGWSDDADDAGGATLCGVTLQTYKTYCARRGDAETPDKADLRAMPYVEWHDIVKSLYWDAWKADKISSQMLACLLVDWVWASGSWGIRKPQLLLDVKADGVVGAKTLAALEAADTAAFFAKVHAARLVFVDDIAARKPTQAKWLRGWKRRINAITFNGFVYG